MADEPTAPEGDEPTGAAASAPEEVGTSATETEVTDPYDDRFDPASLPDELRGEWKRLKGDYTRKTQTLAEERREAREALELQQALRDPDRRAEALAAYGLSFEDEDDDFDYQDDPTTALEQRLAAIEAERAQEQAQGQEAELEEMEIDFINQSLTDLSQSTGRDDFSPEEIQAIGDLSRVRRTPEGFPDVQGAYELLYTGVLPKERERWIASKQSPQAPNGSTAVEKPDLSTPQGRSEYAAARLAEQANDT